MRKSKTLERLKESFGKPKEDYYQFELIESYFRNKDNSECFQVLSDKTCNDLDFEDIFMFLDRTNSKIGQQYLYNQLRTIPLNSNKLDSREKFIKKFSEDEVFRIETQCQLEKLNNENAYFIASLFQEEHIKSPKWFLVIRVLSFLSVLSLIMAPVDSQIKWWELSLYVKG